MLHFVHASTSLMLLSYKPTMMHTLDQKESYKDRSSTIFTVLVEILDITHVTDYYSLPALNEISTLGSSAHLQHNRQMGKKSVLGDNVPQHGRRPPVTSEQQ